MLLLVASVLIAIAFSLLPGTHVAQPVLTVADEECAGVRDLRVPPERAPRMPVQAPILLAEERR
jgi:hypothetical protein